jgi:hypothetical protein
MDGPPSRYGLIVAAGSLRSPSAALLRELRLLAEGHLEPAESILSSPPPLAIADLPERAVDADVLRALLSAITSRMITRTPLILGELAAPISRWRPGGSAGRSAPEPRHQTGRLCSMLSIRRLLDAMASRHPALPTA